LTETEPSLSVDPILAIQETPQWTSTNQSWYLLFFMPHELQLPRLQQWVQSKDRREVGAWYSWHFLAQKAFLTWVVLEHMWPTTMFRKKRWQLPGSGCLNFWDCMPF
jgi:hypothetical protein